MIRPPSRWAWLLFDFWLAVGWFLLGLLNLAYGAEPASSRPYRADVIRAAHATVGLDAPIALYAGQIEQESRWRPGVCSAFACGLTQFTKTTAADLGRQHPELGPVDVFNPAWAIRALVTYDTDLFKRTGGATACDHWAFTLSAYNGGLGWVPRDKALTRAHGKDPTRWWGNVELYTSRLPKYAAENRGYPRSILLTKQLHYASWGGTVPCPVNPR